MKSWQSVSLVAWLKDLNVEVILISGFMNSEIRDHFQFFVELNLISEITNSESHTKVSTSRNFVRHAPGFCFIKTLFYFYMSR